MPTLGGKVGKDKNARGNYVQLRRDVKSKKTEHVARMRGERGGIDTEMSRNKGGKKSQSTKPISAREIRTKNARTRTH